MIPTEASFADVMIIEQLVRSKWGDESLGDDVVFVSDDFVAVIDGVSAVEANKFGALSSGRFAANCVANTLANLNAKANATEALALFSGALDHELKIVDWVGATDQRPAAVFAIYSRQRSEVWRLCDANVMINGQSFPTNETPIGQIAVAYRAAMLEARLQQGASVDDILADDPTQPHVRPLADTQRVFRNRADSQWGYGVVDGTPVPIDFLDVIPVPPDAHVVLTTDGYPAVFATLSESEKNLRSVLDADPLVISKHRGWRCVTKEMESFDDRAYISFKT